jgi:hypothetical protein
MNYLSSGAGIFLPAGAGGWLNTMAGARVFGAGHSFCGQILFAEDSRDLRPGGIIF